MKRLLVNAFCPGEHKVVSMPEPDPDLSRVSSESFPAAWADPCAPPVVSKRNEPTFAHQGVKLRSKRRSFRRPEIIVDRKPADIVEQVTAAIIDGVQKNSRATDRARHSVRAANRRSRYLRQNSTALLSDTKYAK